MSKDLNIYVAKKPKIVCECSRTVTEADNYRFTKMCRLVNRETWKTSIPYSARNARSSFRVRLLQNKKLPNYWAYPGG